MHAPRRRLCWGVALLGLVGTAQWAPPVYAQWVENGVHLGFQCTEPRVHADGSGGALIGVTDRSASDYTARGFLVTAEGGTSPGWPVDGLLLDSATVSTDDLWQDACVQPDGSLTITFVRTRERRLYATRLRPDGTRVPGWDPVFQLAPGVSGQDLGKVVATPDGGNFVLWQAGGLSQWDVWMQRLTADGQPAPGWPAAGHEVGAGPAMQYAWSPLLHDGADGAWLAYFSSDGGVEAEVYVLRTDGLGDPAPGFPLYGLSPTHAPGIQAQPWLARDGGDGVYVAWCDARSGAGIPDPDAQAYYDIYLQHLSGTGEVMPGWPSDGLPVCVWPGSQQEPRLQADGNGGVYVAWDGGGPQGTTAHAQHVLADGTLAPGWPEGGLRMFAIATSTLDTRLATDQMGGLFLATQISVGGLWRVYVQHATAGGVFDAPWGAVGLPVVDPNIFHSQDWPRLCPSAPGSVIVAWNDARSGSGETYAARVSLDGVVATKLSLVSQEASFDHVALAWSVGGNALVSATLERREASGTWQPLATVSPDGTGTLRYEDRDVVPGSRYGYRLRWQEATGPGQSAEVWVEVPLASRFALAGASPNPSPRAALTVAYSLAERGPARLELYDAQGRAVARHDLTASEPGAHVERFTAISNLRTGLYWLRLVQGANSATARVVLVD